MIMLISIDAFYNIFSFEIQSYKSVEGQSVNWNLRKTNKNASNNSVHLLCLIPRMLSNVLNAISYFRIRL